MFRLARWMRERLTALRTYRLDDIRNFS